MRKSRNRHWRPSGKHPRLEAIFRINTSRNSPIFPVAGIDDTAKIFVIPHIAIGFVQRQRWSSMFDDPEH
jgi:hypothetical protein